MDDQGPGGARSARNHWFCWYTSYLFIPVRVILSSFIITHESERWMSTAASREKAQPNPSRLKPPAVFQGQITPSSSASCSSGKACKSGPDHPIIIRVLQQWHSMHIAGAGTPAGGL